MNKFVFTLLVALISFGTTQAQDIEGEIEFKYIRAKYLLDTERYEDAIKTFTEVIKEQEDFSDALILRAESKYKMAAYRGTKKDILLYASLKGLTPKAIVLLAKADYKMGNMDAALNSLSTATELQIADADIFLYAGNIYQEKEQDNEACYMWKKAATMGSSKANISLKKECGDFVDAPVTKRRNTGKIDGNALPNSKKEDGDSDSSTAEVDMKNNTSQKSDEEKENENDLGKLMNDKILNTDDVANSETSEDPVDHNNDGQSDDEEDIVADTLVVKEDPVIEENVPEEDNTPNEIEVDEDLTLIIKGQGLGKRRVLEQPNILILSDVDGIVAVDICVNKRGKVESAEFNSRLSTIAKKSLVSLAIRKSKDFWFEKNDFKEQCGVIIFEIKGS